YGDWLSCLHALEHVGVGRYGDQVNPDGFNQGLANLARLLRPNGLLYLSVPIGMPRVEFNAQAVSDPREVVRLAKEASLTLKELSVIRPGGAPETFAADLGRLAGERYA